MPDKKTPYAKCHICGQKIPFTYGNPKELIQHMLQCHDQETNQNVLPSCCPNNKPCVNIVDCSKKLAKCTTCGGKRQTGGKSATLYNLPENAPAKCTICVDSSKQDSCKSGFPNKSAPIKSNNASCIPACPNKSSSRINLGDFTTPLKLRIRCKSSKSIDKPNKSQEKCASQNNDKVCPLHPKNETSKNKSKKCSELGKNRKLPVSLDTSKVNSNKIIKCNSPIDKNKRIPSPSDSVKKFGAKRRSSSLIETNRKLSPSVNRQKIKKTYSGSSNSIDQNKDCCLGKCGISPDKNRRLSKSVDKSTVCNKTVCFANNVSGEPKGGKHSIRQYSPCNLVKRKGTKEMFKTTLETWTAGCGSINCPKCNRKVVPLIRKKKNKMAFTSVGASLLLTCWPFCFLIPTLHNCSVDLYCPCCKYKLGVYNSSTGKTTSVCCTENI